MSGVKTTSIFGSLINLVVCWCVMARCRLEPCYLSVLGDDIDLSFEESISPSVIYDSYEMIKFPVAVDKTKFT